MKILMAVPSRVENSFVENTVGALNVYCKVDVGLDGFFNEVNDFSVVHIHWPEALFNWEYLDRKKLLEVKERLVYLKKNSKIIVTRHNVAPHYRDGLLYQELYELIYSFADGMIHMGGYSLEEFTSKYGSKYNNIEHVIIPHGVYDNLDNSITRKDSRLKLNIPADANVVCVFGAIRHTEEESLILNMFGGLDVKNKMLLASHWRYWTKPSLSKRRTLFELPWLVCKRLIWELKNYFDQALNRKRLNGGGFIKDEEIQDYLNAADVIFVPRLHGLNSGNILLAFTFRKVVVGPNIGNMGGVLIQSNNPVFDPFDLDSVIAAVEQGFVKARMQQGEKNYNYAMKNMSWDLIAQKHMAFYKKITKSEYKANG